MTNQEKRKAIHQFVKDLDYEGAMVVADLEGVSLHYLAINGDLRVAAHLAGGLQAGVLQLIQDIGIDLRLAPNQRQLFEAAVLEFAVLTHTAMQPKMTGESLVIMDEE